jgi:tetratricopeptide (TPR) repeat protein
MTRLVYRSVVCLPILVVGLLAAQAGWTQSATQQREAAVLKARAGQMAEAQAALRAMLAAGIDDGLVAMDLVTLLQQDGKAAEAVAEFEKAAKRDPPDYALLAATRAYRDLRRYGDAARLARDGMRRFPDDTVWPLVLSLILSDDGKSAEALEILRQPAAQRAPPVERLLAEAYAWRRAGDAFKAMRVYGEAIKAAPDNKGVRAEAAGVLQDMGAPFGAEIIAGTATPSIAADQAAAMFDGAPRSAAPIRRAVSMAPMPRSRGSISCWRACRRRRPKRDCAVACGSSAWRRCTIACACRR